MSSEEQQPINQVNIGSQVDALHEYRIGKLEEVVGVLSDSLSEIASTVKGAKWAIAVIFGFIQPIVIGVAIYLLTK